MTPVYLNSFPLVELKDHHQNQNLQLFLSPQQAAAAAATNSSSLQCSMPTDFFNPTATHDEDQRVLTTSDGESKPHHDHKVIKFMTTDHEDPISDQQASSSSSSSVLLLQSAAAAASVDHSTAINGGSGGHNFSFTRSKEGDGDGDYHESASDNGSSVKWMPSKIRLMRKMMNNSNCNIPANNNNNNNNQGMKLRHKLQYPMHERDNNSSNSSVRVCSDCNTTTTPLWRSGPRGPKSLCNACGIRQRKARRAMEAAAANGGGAAATDHAVSSMNKNIKVHNIINKEKKCRKQYYSLHNHNHQSQKKLCFKEFALSLSENSSALRRAVFPQDVEDAAILLMELSCGLLHS